MKELKLKRLDTALGWFSDDQLKDMLVIDLPIFNKDGRYYSRSLKRQWDEVRGKTYETRPLKLDSGSFDYTVEERRKIDCAHFLYTYKCLDEEEKVCGVETVKVLYSILKLLPPEVQKSAVRAIEINIRHEEVRTSNRSLMKLLKKES